MSDRSINAMLRLLLYVFIELTSVTLVNIPGLCCITRVRRKLIVTNLLAA